MKVCKLLFAALLVFSSAPFSAYGEETKSANQPQAVRRFSRSQAVRVCRDAIRDQIADQYQTSRLQFPRASQDVPRDHPDHVSGSVDVLRGRKWEAHRFSCSVSFDDVKIRTARLE